MRLLLRKFDMGEVKDDQTIVMIGKRNTGKSFLIKDLLYHHRDLPIGSVISPSESVNRFFGDIVPPLFIHEEYTPAIVENVIKRQKVVIKKIEDQKRLYGTCNLDPRAFLIMDDCLYNDSWAHNKSIRFIFLNGRHVKLMYVVSMQHPLGVPPVLRTNVDIVFILRENLFSNRKRIYENWAGMFPTFDVFCQCLDQTTEDFHALVINNNARSNRLDQQVFWYKAESHDGFRLCSRTFWQMSEQLAAERASAGGAGCDDDEEDISTMNVRAKRNAPLVNVKRTIAY